MNLEVFSNYIRNSEGPLKKSTQLLEEIINKWYT